MDVCEETMDVGWINSECRDGELLADASRNGDSAEAVEGSDGSLCRAMVWHEPLTESEGAKAEIRTSERGG